MVSIAKVYHHDLVVNGKQIVDAGWDNRTQKSLWTDFTDIPPTPKTVEHSRQTYYLKQGAFEEGVCYTATHKDGYLVFVNGDKEVTYFHQETDL